MRENTPIFWFIPQCPEWPVLGQTGVRSWNLIPDVPIVCQEFNYVEPSLLSHRMRETGVPMATSVWVAGTLSARPNISKMLFCSMQTAQFIHSPTDGCVACFRPWAIADEASLSICVKVCGIYGFKK